MKMGEYKKVLKRRIAFARLYNVVVLLVIVLGHIHSNSVASSNVRDFISGCHLGLCLGMQMVAIVYLANSSKALRNEEKLKKLYIFENDERNKLIRAKCGGAGVNAIIIGLMLGVLVAGYLNETVFFTLLCATVFVVAVKGTLKIYYTRRT